MLDKISELLDRLCGLPRRQLGVLLLLAVLGLLAAYALLKPPSRPAGDFHAAGGRGPAEGDGEARGEEAAGELTVHVAGAVAHPGVVLLAPGDRVVDAIAAAGGPLPEADLEGLNLAQSLQDGQKVAVPRRGEGGEADMPHAGADAGERRINLNTADAKRLEELPGIGPTLAGRIVAYREKHGGFRSVDELKKVSGIGNKKFEELRDLVEI